jgi:HAD superfamily hydrolase (TIGR01549 family)
MDLAKNTRLIIFDFDGTLHTLPIDWQKMREAAGIADSKESLGDAIERLKKEKQTQTLQKITQVEEQSLAGEKLELAIKQTLQMLQSKFKVAILSRNSSIVIEAFLRANDIAPIYTVGREDVDKLKPNPSGINIILQHFNVQTSETILVGDTFHDVEVARRSGVSSIIINNSKVSNRPDGADFYINSISELPILIEERFGSR